MELKMHHSRNKLQKESKPQGWVKQFTTDEPRLSEAVELYESLGYEVCLEKAVLTEDNETCRTCFLVDCDKCKTIYIRRKKSAEV